MSNGRPTNRSLPHAAFRPAPDASAHERAALARAEDFFSYWSALPRADTQRAPHLRTLLDNPAPPLQPAIALVDVVPPASLPVRLFGSEREAAFGLNITRRDALDFYAPHLRRAVFARAACVVEQPVGWLTRRLITSTRGSSVRFLSLSLPLAVDSGAPPVVVNFGAAMDRQPNEDFPARVNAISGGAWLDLGAGVPALPPGV
jgi:hypothetical protein